MKLKLGISSITSLIVTTILLYVLYMKYNKKLPELPTYRIVSNTGQSIPAKPHITTINVKIKNNS